MKEMLAFIRIYDNKGALYFNDFNYVKFYDSFGNAEN